MYNNYLKLYFLNKDKYITEEYKKKFNEKKDFVFNILLLLDIDEDDAKKMTLDIFSEIYRAFSFKTNLTKIDQIIYSYLLNNLHDIKNLKEKFIIVLNSYFNFKISKIHKITYIKNSEIKRIIDEFKHSEDFKNYEFKNVNLEFNDTILPKNPAKPTHFFIFLLITIVIIAILIPAILFLYIFFTVTLPPNKKDYHDFIKLSCDTTYKVSTFDKNIFTSESTLRFEANDYDGKADLVIKDDSLEGNYYYVNFTNTLIDISSQSEGFAISNGEILKGEILINEEPHAYYLYFTHSPLEVSFVIDNASTSLSTFRFIEQ